MVFGIIGGILGFFWFLGVYHLGGNPFYSFWQKLVVLVQGGVAFFAIKYFRDKVNEGSLSFGEGVLTGLLVAIVTALVSGTGEYFYAEYVKPEMVQSHLKQLYAYFEANKEELIRRSSVKMYEGNYKAVGEVNAFTLTLDEIIWKIVRGTMFAVLVSLALRRQTVKL